MWGRIRCVSGATSRWASQAALSETVLKKAGEPEDVARAVLFLLTEMSAHVTGQVLRVDGGQLIG